ncbi:MAG: 50S ribosomal protein L21 [Deltaproteobacteria bacterium]|nr:MAG: 50S ribosomal protein L21 [Deltaproteobacteria bacterium]
MVIEVSGKQYYIGHGDKIQIDLCQKVAVGDLLVFEKQIIKTEEDGEKTKVADTLNRLVQGVVMGVRKRAKVIIFKKKRRHGYMKKQGHRQSVVEVLIEEVNYGA